MLKMLNFDIDFLARGFHLDKNGSVKIKIDDETEVNGWWAYGNLVKLGDNFYIANETNSFVVEDWSVCKCVGITPDNHPVFTHDIISYTMPETPKGKTEIGEVVPVNQFVRIDGRYWTHLYDISMGDYKLACEVIGNIFETPEKLTINE